MWGKALGNHQGGAIWLHCFVAQCGGKAQRRDRATDWLLQVCLVLAHFPVTSPTPCMRLAPFHLLVKVDPRVSSSAYVLSPWRPFKLGLLKIWQFLLLSQTPLVFITRSYGDLSSLCWKPGLWGLTWCWDHLLSRFLSRFLSNIGECGIDRPFHCCLLPLPLCVSTPLPISTTLSLLSIWMNVAALNHWLSGFHSVRFSDSFGCHLF